VVGSVATIFNVSVARQCTTINFLVDFESASQ